MQLLAALLVEIELRKQGKTGRLGNLSPLELMTLAQKFVVNVNIL